MTDKKEKIINAALELFANDGFSSTSTRKIAEMAGVSEGLIFRHFGNKKGLLEAIVKDAEKRVSEIFAQVIFETDPAAVIRNTLLIPFNTKQIDYHYWKLQFKLKWEDEFHKPHKMQPLLDKLTWAFESLDYASPEYEAILVSMILDAIATEVLRSDKPADESLKNFLLQKYAV